MKLPRLRRKPAPETAEPASASRAVPVLQVLIYSNTGLSEQEFSAQTDKIGRVASYDLLDPLKVSTIGSSTGFGHTPQPRRPEHAEQNLAIKLISVTAIAAL